MKENYATKNKKRKCTFPNNYFNYLLLKSEHSTKINKARLSKMEARDKAMLKCFGEA